MLDVRQQTLDMQSHSFCTNNRLPVFRETPHGVRRCHEVTEETAAVSGWRVKRD